MDFKISDLKVDVFSPGGNSGWGLKPEVAVRITHVPTGIYVEEKGDRSQHRNRAEAMRKLEIVFALLPECVDRKAEETRNSILDEAINKIESVVYPSNSAMLTHILQVLEDLKFK